MAKRREKQVEERLRDRAKQHGGVAYKFTSPGRRSVPDRLMIVPGWAWLGCTIFVEAKAPGQKPTKSQLREHIKLRKLGCMVFVVDNYDEVDMLFEFL